MDQDNLRTAMTAFDSLGYRPRAPVAMEEFAHPDKRERWVREKDMKVFSPWNPDLPATEIDPFVEEPIPFEEVYNRRIWKYNVKTSDDYHLI